MCRKATGCGCEATNSATIASENRAHAYGEDRGKCFHQACKLHMTWKVSENMLGMDFALGGSAPQPLAEHPLELAAGSFPEFNQHQDGPAGSSVVVFLDAAEL